MAWSRSPAALPIRWRQRASIAQRVTVVHSGVDCDRFRPPTSAERADARSALGISDDEFVISAVGALEQRKGHRYLIEAIGTLMRQPKRSSR